MSLILVYDPQVDVELDALQVGPNGKLWDGIVDALTTISEDGPDSTARAYRLHGVTGEAAAWAVWVTCADPADWWVLWSAEVDASGQPVAVVKYVGSLRPEVVDRR